MTRTLLNVLAATVVVFGVAGCSDGAKPAAHGLTRDSSCSAYLKAADADRARGLREVAAELAVPDAVTALGMSQVDYNCVQQSDLSLGESIALLASDGSAGASASASSAGEVGPEAQEAAEAAVVPFLSYSWRTIGADMAAAEAVSTPSFWKGSAEPLWQVVRRQENTAKSTVSAQVVASAFMGVEGDGRPTYLLFVNRPTSIEGGTATVYKDVVVVTMASSGDGWLIDAISSNDQAVSPTPSAEAEAAVARAVEFVQTVNTYGPSMLDGQGHLTSYAANLEQLLTPEFVTSFRSGLSAAESSVRDAHVSRSAEITAAGASKVSDGTARVLVAGSFQNAVIGKKDAPVPVRLEVTLAEVDGVWLVDNFVPVA